MYIISLFICSYKIYLYEFSQGRESLMIKAIDFFCGAGGLTRGLLNAGIEVLAGVDNDERLRETYTHNNKPSRFINKDIKKIKIAELREELGIQNEDTTLYAACTPCQPFSTLSRLKDKDGKKILLLSFAKIVRTYAIV